MLCLLHYKTVITNKFSIIPLFLLLLIENYLYLSVLERIKYQEAHDRLLFGSHETSPIQWVGREIERIGPAKKILNLFRRRGIGSKFHHYHICEKFSFICQPKPNIVCLSSSCIARISKCLRSRGIDSAYVALRNWILGIDSRAP